MSSEGCEKNRFLTHLQLPLTKIKRAGTTRATSSIIKSGQKDTEASITEIDREQKLIILYEGIVCAAGRRHQKWSEKQNKYAECRAGLLNLYEGYTVKQVNIVFDFIGGYSKNLFKILSEAIPKDTMKIKKLIDNMQRAVLFGSSNIVRRFKAF